MTAQSQGQTSGNLAPRGRGAAVLDALAFAVYPFAAWYVLTRASLQTAGWILLVALVPRTWVLLRRAKAVSRREILGPPAVISVLVALSIWLDDPRFLLALPSLIAVTLFVAFARTLRTTPMVEHYARLAQPELSAAEIRHCRQATWGWCGFFLLNGAFSAWLAFQADATVWALYTGLGSYVAVGMVFALEYGVRVWRFGFARATPGFKRGQAEAP